MTEQKKSVIEQLRNWFAMSSNLEHNHLLFSCILELAQQLDDIETRLGGFKHDGNVANNLERVTTIENTCKKCGKSGTRHFCDVLELTESATTINGVPVNITLEQLKYLQTLPSEIRYPAASTNQVVDAQIKTLKETKGNKMTKIHDMESEVFIEKLRALLESKTLVKANCSFEVDGQFYVLKGFVIKQKVHLSNPIGERIIGDFTIKGELEVL
jgi:hypothetical protein